MQTANRIHEVKNMRKYNLRRDLIDHRDDDFLYRIPWLSRIDKYSDLELGFSPVEDQEALGSCTGNGFGAVIEYNEKIENPYHVDVSRLFIYYNERERNNQIYEDAGARIRDGIKALAQHGVCDEVLWPYDITRFTEKPSDEAYKDALKRRIKEYRRLTTLDHVRHALSQGTPVVFGFAVFSSFDRPEVGVTGRVPLPWKFDKLVGGHCVVMAGHNDKTELFKWKNSYGTKWGDRGYGYFSYEYFKKFAMDCWVITQ